MPHKLSSNNWFTEVYRESVENPDSQSIASLSLPISKKLHEETTAYQKAEIFESPFWGKVLILDGCIMLTERDNFIYHEMLTHPALFSHANPRDVIIIGGGDCGTLREILKHKTVQKAIQVEIDERVTHLSEKYFPELCVANTDPRAEFLFQDGILWMNQARPHTQDVIFVDSTDPVGPAKGLFQETFYRDCFRVLRSDGIFVQQTESPFFNLSLITALRALFKKVGFLTVQTFLFPLPTYPSGYWSVTLASKCKEGSFRARDVENKSFETRYYTAEVHRQAATLPPFIHPHPSPLPLAGEGADLSQQARERG